MTSLSKTKRRALLESSATYFQSSRNTRITSGGVLLTRKDSLRVRKAYELWVFAQIDIMLQAGYDSCHISEKNIRNYWDFLVTSDIQKNISDVKAMLDVFRSHTPDYGKCTLRSFLQLCDLNEVSIKARVFDLVRPLMYKYVRALTKVARWDPELSGYFSLINTFLQFMLRLTIKDDDRVMAENLEKYVSFERECKTWVYDPQLLAELREELRPLCREYELEMSDFYFSNGATSDVKKGSGRLMKVNDISKGLDEKLSCMNRRYGYSIPFFNVAPWEYKFDSRYHRREILPMVQGRIPVPTYKGQLLTTVDFVAKGIDKKRVISMEPTAKQYAQSGIRNALGRVLENHPEWKIDLHDQTHNQKLALLGSKLRNYATIDLSSASDSVTYYLVKHGFTGQLRRDLVCARTQWALLPDGNVIKLEKFAPMGANTCFIVMCCVLSAVVKLAEKHVGVHHTQYRVYGDDLVVHESVYFEVCKILSQLHFTVNMDKTFNPWDSFKESCGVEAIGGYDVTPLRLSRQFDPVNFCAKDFKDRSPEQFSCLRDLANRAFQFKFESLRWAVLRIIAKQYPPCLFFTEDEHGNGILTDHAVNHHLKGVTYSDTRQCVTASVLLPVATATRGDSHDAKRSLAVLLRDYETTKRTCLIDPLDRISANSGPTVRGWKRCSIEVTIDLENNPFDLPLVPPGYWSR